ncbi:MAG: hypothetical protein AAF558_12500 [Verrucomicrobiota bacterium]
MSPEQKWELVGALELEARSLCRSRLKKKYPEWEEARISAEVNRWWIHASS